MSSWSICMRFIQYVNAASVASSDLGAIASLPPPAVPTSTREENVVRTDRLLYLRTAAVLLPCLILASLPARSETWPERTVRIISPFGPGISPDAAARIVGEGLAKRWKQAVVVENKPGGDTIVGTQAFLAARDSHTLLFTAQ